jgi:tetratricopeptide (TPR) repeat protein/transglutaminase-like putative cysteine protease
MHAHMASRLLLPLLLACLVEAHPVSPEQASFSASPQALMDAFSGLQADGNAVSVLFEDARFELDKEGCPAFRFHTVFKVWTKAGADNRAMIEERWGPWQEQRPTLRARVILPDGTTHELDPKTIADLPVHDDDENVLTDRRMVRAALPAIGPGAIVEQESVRKQTALSLRAGTVRSFYFGGSAPIEHTHMLIRAGQEVPIRFKLEMLPHATVKDQTKNGMREIVIEQGPVKPAKDAPSFLAPDESRYPRVVFSTAPSWKDVAEEYASVVDKQLNGFDGSRYLPKFAPGASRDAKILAIVSKTNQEIRYTGIEFSQASVVPRRPAEVLERKYGDCKDKSTLVVALLRAAGIEAHVALLYSSTGADIQPDLPGMDVFNHAIVYVPGKPELWLDPTDPDLRLHVMSPSNQGRRALIAKIGTTDFIMTPELGAEENRVIEKREFWLSELGRAKITESSEAFGTADRGYRGGFGDRDQKGLRESLKDYIDWTYGEAKIRKITTSERGDLTQPFRLAIELDDAQRGTSGRTEAAVGILLAGITNRLPQYFREEAKPKKDEKDALPEKRTQDYFIEEPFTQEWHYILHAPAGFRIRELPEAKEERLGPATLRARFVRENDVTVLADFRFSMPKRRFTAADGEALRDAMVELGKRKTLLIFFDQVGETALASGRVREALAEFAALRKLHPQEALHAMQAARAMLAAGAGESARAEARRAVAMEPGSAKAYIQLAEILKHDLVGRPLEKGFDPDGAAAAYRKALELDPKDHETRANLAILLEFNRSGVRYGAGSRLEEALVEYKKIAEQLAGLGLPQNYAVALLRAGHYPVLKEYLEKQPDSESNLALRVCAEAMLKGSKAAVQSSGSVSGVEARQRVLSSAAQTLVSMRQYALAADVFEETMAGAANPAALSNIVRVLRTTKRYEDAPITVKEPEDAVRLFVDRAVRCEDHKKDWMESVSNFAKGDAVSLRRLEEFQRGAADARRLLRKSGVSFDVGYDLGSAALQYSHSGSDEAGWVVRFTAPGSGVTLTQDQTFFVVREDNRYRLIGGPWMLEGVARLVLKLVADGKLEKARSWVTRARQELRAGSGDDPLAKPLLCQLWEPGQSADAPTIRRAAAVLLSAEDGDDVAITILEKAVKSAESGKSAILRCALGDAYFARKRYREALQIGEGLLKEHPQSQTALMLTLRAAYAAGGKKEADRVADASLRRLQDNAEALGVVAKVAMIFGDTDRCISLEERIIDMGRGTAVNYNSLAWAELMAGKTTTKTLEIANKGLLMLGNQQLTGLMHTLAAVQAELGKTSEARAVILQRMKENGSAEPDDDDWYVFGRIAEQYGLTHEAAVMYRKLAKPKEDFAVASSSYELAQRRLEEAEAASQ